MSEHTSAQIAPPPSLDDILSAGAAARLGSVDFTTRLTPQPDPESVANPLRARAGTAAPVGGPDARAPRPDSVGTAADAAEEVAAGPVILPVAQIVDAAADEVPTDELTAPELSVLSEPAVLPDVPEPGSVDAVAATIIARMRATEDAARRHLESIEAEAARRCELVTAQAELDAELIRLHARREAHAIIAAARMRVGAGTGSAQESQRLHEIGETFSRFAESLETTGAPATGTPDIPQKP